MYKEKTHKEQQFKVKIEDGREACPKSLNLFKYYKTVLSPSQRTSLSELKTLEWWLSRLMLKLLVLLNPRLC